MRGATLIKQPRLNQQITATEVRLIDAEGKQLGVVSSRAAQDQADASGLDLVEISSEANPPVVKIVDWGKFQYEKTKQEQKARRGAKTQEMKQMRFGLKIGRHDLDVKLTRVRSFIAKGHNVKLTVRFRGREIIHPELGHALLENMMETLSDVAVMDQKPNLAGKQLHMLIRPK